MTTHRERVPLRDLAPAWVVVDRTGTALRRSGPVGRYLLPDAAATGDLVSLARDGVRAALREALGDATRRDETAVVRCAPRVEPEGALCTEVVACPLPSRRGPDGTRFLVTFREVRVPDAAAAAGSAPPAPDEALRAEVAALRALLASVDVETSSGEPPADRLRALDDELQTSQQELGILNARLQAVNAELSAKVEELDRLHGAEEASRASEARLEQIVDSVPHLVWTATAAGTRDYFSRQWREYTGLSAGPQLDAGWIEAYHPGDREAMLAAWSTSVRTGAPFEAEYRIRRHDGAYRWFRGRANPLRDRAGAIERWIGTSTDVDDVKRLEASLREGSRRKDEFMALLAHELRNPLAPLGSSLDILRRHHDRLHVARAVEVIDRQVTHLARLVDDLLDVSRITRGKTRIRRERLDLAATLDAILEDHRPLFAAAGLHLEATLPAGPLWVDGDPARLAQMVENLLQNARKFTGAGGTVTLGARTEDGGRAVAVSIRDTGIGMDPASVEGMFEAFAQGDATLARSRGGLGLGLTLVRALAELHGGSVHGSSEGQGRGSEFVLRLPLTSPPAQGAKPPRAGAAARRRVLVVDDNQDAAETFAELLRLEGHDVRVAGDGRTALEEARRFRPEVAFCDIGLPGQLDGYALARALRAEPGLEHALLVAMTGYATEDDRRRAREAGFDLHFAKPARIDAITGALARWTPAGPRPEPAPADDERAAW